MERSHAIDGWGGDKEQHDRKKYSICAKDMGYMGGVHGGANHGEGLGNRVNARNPIYFQSSFR